VRTKRLPPSQVYLLYMPGPRPPGNGCREIVSSMQRIVAGRVDLHTATLMEHDPRTDRVRTAFGIPIVPSLVISKPWPGLSLDDVDQQPEMPAYCVIEDAAIFHDVPRLTREVEHLTLVWASATTPEIAAALRTRRFRMLVWTASCRLDEVIGYLTQLKVRFVLGSVNLPLRFDEQGWAVDDDPPNGASAWEHARERSPQPTPQDATAQAIDEMIAEGGPVPPSPAKARTRTVKVLSPGKALTDAS
jgi:hypothetical protein